MAAALLIGGEFWWHSVRNGMQQYWDFGCGIGVVARFDWPAESGAAPSVSFDLSRGTFSSTASSSHSQYYSDELGYWVDTGNADTAKGSQSENAELAIAVDYDGDTEVLLLLVHDSSNSTDLTATESGGTYSASGSESFSFRSTNGKISLAFNTGISTAATLSSWLSQRAYTVPLVVAADLIAGTIFITRWFAVVEENYAGTFLVYATRGIAIQRNDTEIYRASITELSAQSSANPVWAIFDASIDYEAFGPFSSSSTSRSGYYDATRGHIEDFHYGKGPTVLMARDERGNSIESLAYNQWAPLVNAPGYRTAGGFDPNTTQLIHRLSDGANLAQVIEADNLTGMEWVIKSIAML